MDKNNFFSANTITYSQQYIFYRTEFKNKGNEYIIIIQTLDEYSYYRLLHEMAWFLVFSLPFSIVFYFLGYFFVGKNLRPIQEIINSLEDFSGNLNHEIKTPLTEIVSTLSLTKRIKTNYDEAIDQSLRSAYKIDKILDSMRGMVTLVDASYQKEKIEIAPVLREIIKDFQPDIEKKQLELHTKFSDESLVLKINRAHLDLCVGNVLKNAIKYSNEKGQVYIHLEAGKLQIRDF